ncbi:MAG: hypothetical protein KA210_12305, partial [Bacteroidia bacterium]|nr:hypothetical protein [Bacteroidia bacterium]
MRKLLQITLLGVLFLVTQNDVYGQCYTGTVNRHAGTWHSNLYVGASKTSATNVLVAWGENSKTLTTGSGGVYCVPTIVPSSSYTGVPVEVRGASSTGSSNKNIFVLRTEDAVTPSNSKIYLYGDGTLPAMGIGGTTLVATGSEFSSKLPTGVTMADIAFVQVSPVTLAIVTTTGNVYVTGSTTTSILYGDGSATSTYGNNWHKVLIAGGTTALSGVTKLSLSAGGAMALSGNNMYFFGKNAYVTSATLQGNVTKATLINGTTIMPTLAAGENIVDVIGIGDGAQTTSIYFLTSKGQLFVNGENNNGELGNGTVVSASVIQPTFTTVIFPSGVNTTTNPIIKIDASTESSTDVSAIGAMDKNGNLYTWGSNDGSLIGGSAGLKYNLPRQINFQPNSTLTASTSTVIPVNDFTIGGHFSAAFDGVNDAYWYLGHFKTASMGAVGNDPLNGNAPYCTLDTFEEYFFKVDNTSIDFGFNCSNALPTATISTTNLLGFTACSGVVSANKTFTANATNLVADLVITAPTGYELCLTAGGTFTTSLTISPVSGAVNNKVIYVRLASTATNGASGNILLTSTNATDITVATGTAVINSAPAITTQPSAVSQNVTQGATPANLSVTATGAGLTYQWFSNTTNTTTGGTLLSSATNATYTPLTTSVGTLYYYVVVSGTCSPAVTSSVSGDVVTSSSNT